MTVAASSSDNESQRMTRLRALGILDTDPELLFDVIVKLAANICGVPICLISLADSDRHWFKANYGLPGVQEIPQDVAFCLYALQEDVLLEVQDTHKDPRFFANPLVTGGLQIRFYAGVPLKLNDGLKVGTLCIAGQEPKKLTQQQSDMLQQLAELVAQCLEARHQSIQAAATNQHMSAYVEHLYVATPAMLYTMTLDQKILSVSDAWLNEMGCVREEIIGRVFTDFLTPGSKRFVEFFALPKLKVEGKCVDVEFQMQRRDGSVIDVLWSAAVDCDEQGDPIQVLCIINNITINKLTESALADQLAYNKALINNMVDGILIVSAKGLVESINPAASQLFGYSAEEAVGVNISRIIPGEDAEKYNHYLSMDSATGVAFAFSKGRELYGQHKLGNRFPLELSVSRYFHDDDPIFICTVRDISERKQHEQSLLDSRKQYEEITRRFHVTTQAAEVGVWEWDIVNNQLVWDEVMFSLYGVVDRSQFIGAYESWRNGLHPDDVDECHRTTAMVLLGQAEYNCEFRVIWQDKSIHHIRARATVERDQDARPIRMLGINWDVTEQRLAEKQLSDSKVLLERTGYVAGVGGWDVNLHTGVLTWSDETCRLHDLEVGYCPTMQEAFDFYPPESRTIIMQAFEDAIAFGKTWDLELELVSAKGRHFWARTVGSIEFDNGKPIRLYGAFQDVSARKDIERQLEENLQLMQITLDSIADAVITTDIYGKVQWLNPSAEKLTGWSKSKATGKPLQDVFVVVDEETRKPVQNSVARCLAEGKVSSMEKHTLLMAADNMEYGIEDSASPIRNSKKEIVGAVLVFHDVSMQRRHSNEMNYRATHDALTGLINRAEFEAQLQAMLENAQREHSENALMYIDLDQFKVVNDACGHSLGDQLLIQVTALIQRCVRSQDLVARIGGDEFAVLLHQCDVNHALRVGQNICDAMDEFRFQHDGRRFRVGTSIGLVPVDDRWPSISEVLQAADTCCYAAKDAGRNRVHIWFDADHQIQARQGEMQWVSRIEHALDENRFELYGQRISAIRDSGSGLHCEILLRMKDADGSIIPPGAFLPAAERFHMAPRIDRWVLRNVFEWMKSVKNTADEIEMIAINLSGQSIGDKTFHRYLVEIIARAEFDVSKLCFEITETAAITNLGDAKLLIDDIRRLGVKVALDDFGAGASSFGYLKTLPVDFLKIDGQFVTDLLEDALDFAAVRCFQDVALVVGVKTIAEFVEREDVLATLKTLGVDYAQGYLIHRPEPLLEMAYRG
ncbi:MAG TPA: EAL domain-containing protein [Cellvibrio sp.]|nr:EAL domain-containing protein [Cellvibrio sp.]